jgi:O-antigen biosynthesis protein WbqP
VSAPGLYRRGAKRGLDIVLAGLAALVLSPLLALIGLCVWLEDRGPCFFRQQRIGRDGHPFTLLKFRSMPVGTANVPSSSAGGLRVTRVGALIRRLNLDELPQLINIVRGEMSIVGPRPALPGQTDLLELRRANAAMALRPGLTGLAQINSYDGMPVARKAAYDGEYARRVGVLLDLTIVVRTVGYLFRLPPVY